MLLLQIRYQDGFVAWLNGVEVARRHLPAGATVATALGSQEAERVLIDLPPGLLQPNSVLAVEVWPAKGRTSSVELALDGSDAVQLLRGPYLQRLALDDSDEGWIVIDTDVPTQATLRYGITGAPAGEGPPLRAITDGKTATHHVLHLSKLQPGIAYRYRLTASANGSQPVEVEAAFHTPPAAGHPLRFVVLGDVRTGHEVHAQIARAVIAEDPDLVLLTGDLVEQGDDDTEWQRFFDVAAPILRQVAVYPAPGNHDYALHNRGRERFLNFFIRTRATPWWSFDVARVHFACVDSMAYGDPEQRLWLERDLAAARQRGARAIFVYDHDGPWSSQMHGDNRDAVATYAPLYERYRATVFSGHDHDYERGRVGNVDYFVSGGGGAELRIPRCGIAGRPRCSARVRGFANEHHYLVVEVLADRVKVCPKRPDGTPLEPCSLLKLPPATSH